MRIPGFLLISPLLVCCLGMPFLTGCSNTAYLAEGEKLYTGADVEIQRTGDTGEEGDLEDRVEGLIKPAPNSRLLGLFRLKLWLYNIGFFPESLGEPPVLFESVAPDRVASRIRTLLHNRGFFNADTRYDIEEEEKTASVRYTLFLQTPYRIRSIAVVQDSTPLAATIRENMTGTLIKVGDVYNLETLTAERDRIDRALKERGFYSFSPDYLVFRADSTAGDRTVDLTLGIKRSMPKEGARVFTIGRVTVYSGYSLNLDSLDVPLEKVFDIDGIRYIDIDGKFAPDAIVRSVFFKPGKLYSREAHDLTLNRLMNLGVFKFVNIRFVETDSAGIPWLHVGIYLTPLLTKTIRLELQGVSKSSNVIGPVFDSSFRNRNLFRGAELLTWSIETGVELPLGSRQTLGRSIEVGTRATLDIPKFLVPFTLTNVSSRFVPKTRIVLGGRFLHRLEYYQMVTLETSFGYTWKENISKEHTFNPIALTLSHVTKTTQRFEDILQANVFIRRSVEQEFTIGPNYAFTYDDQFENDLKNHMYFRGGIDLSGNILSLVQRVFAGRGQSPENPYRIFGTVFSQYSRLDIDFRHYYQTVDRSSTIASRIILGAGFAYGNSSTLPYVKQFFVGGSNSVRAFPARSLGPGSYQTPDSLVSSFIEEAGDVKVEASLEYRFPIVSIFKGALFADAGNIWLLRDDPARPGGKFSFTRLFDEMAVGTGFGLRLDLSFFLIRFDLAFPLRIPSRPAGDRWVIHQIDFGDPAWRKDNLVVNIAVGYPY
jgi:outer membrane protein insertion porin family